jgi:hypothetical protein
MRAAKRSGDTMPPPHRVAYAIERLPGGEAGERMAPMSGWWLAIVLVLAVVVTLGYLYLRTRGPGAPGVAERTLPWPRFQAGPRNRAIESDE